MRMSLNSQICKTLAELLSILTFVGKYENITLTHESPIILI